MKHDFYIDPDISKAETLPGFFYRDSDIFEQLKEKVFIRSWQWIGTKELTPQDSFAHPYILLEDYLNEPMVLIRDETGRLRCFSNVCTHRGNLVVMHPGQYKKLVCMYHGRRFNLGGKFEFMPEFNEVEGFPRACDDLREFRVEQWGPFLFTGPEPAFELNKIIAKIDERVGFLPFEKFRFDDGRSKDYVVNAHWALYCDNYLEGFHIPYVHKHLNDTLDYGNYVTLIDDFFNLQIGYSDEQGEVFDFPAGHIDEGKGVAAYYYWIFPNMMFNFYPWGLSVNIVKPEALNRTSVSFLTYIYDESKLNKGAGASLDLVEKEDEFVVGNVNRGVASRYYGNGRFSPGREQGVHHFHSLLARFLKEDD